MVCGLPATSTPPKRRKRGGGRDGYWSVATFQRPVVVFRDDDGHGRFAPGTGPIARHMPA